MSRLNAAELRAIQSPFRRAVQRHVEMRAFAGMLRAASIDLSGRRVLDAGCGSGYGLALIEERWKPSRLVGVDLMPEQIERATARGVPGAELRVGDVTSLGEPDRSFDAVFVFGILHHVPAWRDALREIARVLEPGGVLAIEELSGPFVDFEDRFLGMSHPREARFLWPDFRAGLAAAGFRLLGERPLLFDAARSFLARREPV
jgi:SAM-dependent methyltransferase